MRKRLGITAILAAAFAAWAASALPAFGADSGTVNMTVTAAAPCLVVAPTTTMDFGTLPFSSPGGPSMGTGAVGFENCSAAAEYVFVRGTDATGGGVTWALADEIPCTSGPDRYAIMLLLAPSFGVGLTTTNKPVQSSQYSPGQVAQHQLQLMMPCGGSSGAGSAMSMQAVFTATF